MINVLTGSGNISAFLNVEFPWNSNILDDKPNPWVSVCILFDMVSKAIIKIKAGKATKPSSLKAEISGFLVPN